MKTKFSGVTDPDPNAKKKPAAKPVSQGPVYTPPNPNLSEDMNFQNAQHNLGMALRFKNALRGVNNNLIPSGQLLDLESGLSVNQQAGGGLNAYTEVDDNSIMKADSVINAVRPMILKRTQQRTGGGLNKLSKGGGIDLNSLSNMF